LKAVLADGLKPLVPVVKGHLAIQNRKGQLQSSSNFAKKQTSSQIPSL